MGDLLGREMSQSWPISTVYGSLFNAIILLFLDSVRVFIKRIFLETLIKYYRFVDHVLLFVLLVNNEKWNLIDQIIEKMISELLFLMQLKHFYSYCSSVERYHTYLSLKNIH